MCAPQAFARRERERKRAAGLSWSDVRPRVWGIVGVLLCGLAAYTVLEQGAPKIYLALIAALALAALFKVVPSRE